MKALLALSSMLAAAVTASAVPLTPAQALDRRAIGELEFSPDGTHLVFTVMEPVKGSARQRNVWMLDVASGQIRQLTFSPKSDSSPRWAPDGQSIAFLSDRDGAAQLYRLPLREGEAGKLTDRKEEIASFRWSPTGTRIAFLMAEAKSDAQEKREKDKDDSRVVDKDTRLARVWTVDVASHELKQMTSAPFRIRQIEWLPGGSLVAAASAKPESDQFNDAIYLVDPDGLAAGRFTPLAAPRGPMGAVAVSPDGKMLAYIGARTDGPEAHDLWLQAVSGGAARN